MIFGRTYQNDFKHVKAMTNAFRAYQEKAYNEIINEITINPKCLVKMFCGSGKSLIMRNVVSHLNNNLSVFVFPSLALIDQFYTDYIDLNNRQNVLRISSDTNSTTKPEKIGLFLKKDSNKIICTTYQSLNILLRNLGENKIGVCCFDEAHHSVGKKYQKSIFEKSVMQKQIFFTATPNNANGIIMQENVQSKDKTDEINETVGNCGNLVYDYSYKQGVEEGYLNKFDVKYDILCSEKKSNSIIYESIARSILTSGNNRVLTFHSQISVSSKSVNSKKKTRSDTCVKKFTNEKLFISAFKRIIETEFPEKQDYYTSIKMIGLDANITQKKRRETLHTFDTSKENEIVIICSCKTIGEGIDTKNANMCVFVDPKTSPIQIIQNIGRVVRKQVGMNKPSSTILIPYWLCILSDEFKDYIKNESVSATCEAIIIKDRKYKKMIEVVNKLIQGEDIIVNNDKILKIKTDEDIEKQNIKKELQENQKIKIWLDYFVRVKDFMDDFISKKLTYTPDSLLSSWYLNQTQHYIEKSKEMEQEQLYVLWGEFTHKYKDYVYLFDDKWNNKLDSLKSFIKNNSKIPSINSQIDIEKKLGSWFSRQKKEYKTKTLGMTKIERYNQWTIFTQDEKYKDYFI